MLKTLLVPSVIDLGDLLRYTINAGKKQTALLAPETPARVESVSYRSRSREMKREGNHRVVGIIMLSKWQRSGSTDYGRNIKSDLLSAFRTNGYGVYISWDHEVD